MHGTLAGEISFRLESCNRILNVQSEKVIAFLRETRYLTGVLAEPMESSADQKSNTPQDCYEVVVVALPRTSRGVIETPTKKGDTRSTDESERYNKDVLNEESGSQFREEFAGSVKLTNLAQTLS